MHTDRSLSSSSSSSFTETAYDWYQRSRRQAVWQELPRDAPSAAWAFCRNANTGISFLDAALRRRRTDALPVLHLTGDCGGKTWTLMSLAARFVAATLPSKFEPHPRNNDKSLHNEDDDDTMMIVNNNDENDDDSETIIQPCVIVLDSTLDITIDKLTHVVRSTVLRQEQAATTHNNYNTSWERNVTDCLRRIHIAQVTNPATDAVPLLEALRHVLEPVTHPTLLLWDGFLSTDPVTRTEVMRQLVRLHENCNVLVVLATTTTTTTTTTTFQSDYSLDRLLVTHRIRLQHRPPAGIMTQQGHEFVAIVQGTQIPFSITSSGILS